MNYPIARMNTFKNKSDTVIRPFVDDHAYRPSGVVKQSVRPTFEKKSELSNRVFEKHQVKYQSNKVKITPNINRLDTYVGM